MPLAKGVRDPPEEGADTLVHLASSPEVADVTGAYFVKRKAVEPSAAARDDAAAKKAVAGERGDGGVKATGR